MMLKTYEIEYNVVDGEYITNVNDPYIVPHKGDAGILHDGILIYNLLKDYTIECEIRTNADNFNCDKWLQMYDDKSEQSVIPISEDYENYLGYLNGKKSIKYFYGNIIEKFNTFKNIYNKDFNFISSNYHIEFKTPIKQYNYSNVYLMGETGLYMCFDSNIDLYLIMNNEYMNLYNNTLCLVGSGNPSIYNSKYQTFTENSVNIKYENNTDKIVPIQYIMKDFDPSITKIHVKKRVYPTLYFNYESPVFDLILNDQIYIEPVTKTIDTDPVTYTIEGTLPAGLHFDEETGIIFGVYTGSEDRSVKVTASNSYTSKSCELFFSEF